MSRILLSAAAGMLTLALTSPVRAGGHSHPTGSHSAPHVGVVSSRHVAPHGYQARYGTRYGRGYYFRPGHFHWSHRHWSRRYHRWYYWNPYLSSWYYWNAPSNGYFPAAGLGSAGMDLPPAPTGPGSMLSPADADNMLSPAGPGNDIPPAGY